MDLAALVGEIAGGSQNALTQLYDATVDWVHGFVHRIVSDPALAEDATQDVYCDVWRRAATYDPGRGSPMAWLCQLARSRALDRLRARRRHERQEHRVDWNLEQCPAETLDPPGLSDRLERERGVHAALARLPEKQRRAIELAFFGGLSQAEVAAFLEEPVGTIKTRIQMGMEKLRQSLRATGRER